jgi:hypothetical protein
VVPDRRRGHARHVGTHDELDRDDFAFSGDRHRRIGNLDDVVRGQVLGDLEPVRCDLVQDLALERDGSQHDVEGADSIGDNDDAAIVLDVAIPDLAGVFLAERWEIGGFQGSSQAEL